jgi:hypothetical protein
MVAASPEMLFMYCAKAAVDCTISMGVKFSFTAPPMVPRNPEIDLISAKVLYI